MHLIRAARPLTVLGRFFTEPDLYTTHAAPLTLTVLITFFVCYIVYMESVISLTLRFTKELRKIIDIRLKRVVLCFSRPLTVSFPYKNVNWERPLNYGAD